MRFINETTQSKWKVDIESNVVMDFELKNKIDDNLDYITFRDEFNIKIKDLNYEGEYLLFVDENFKTHVYFTEEVAPINLTTFELWWDEFYANQLTDIQDVYVNENTYSDYKKMRAIIKGLLEITGWSNLNSIDKKICSRLFLANKQQRDEVHTQIEQMNYAVEFNTKSRDCRYKRYNYVYIFLYNNIELERAKALILDTNVSMMSMAYLEQGIEGTIEDNGIIGLFDYLTSRVGTPFENNGFLEFNMQPYYLTNQQIRDYCVDVLINGNY